LLSVPADRGEDALSVEAHALLASLPHAHVLWRKATATARHCGRAAAGRLTEDKLATLVFRPTRTPMSAARPRS
jgi:hypothetical protein